MQRIHDEEHISTTPPPPPYTVVDQYNGANNVVSRVLLDDYIRMSYATRMPVICTKFRMSHTLVSVVEF